MAPFAIRLRCPRCATPNRNQTGSTRSPALQYRRPPLRAFVATESPLRFLGPSRSAHPTLQSNPRRARCDDTFLLEAPRHPQGGARVAAETVHSSFQSERESPARRVRLWWVTLVVLEREGQGGTEEVAVVWSGDDIHVSKAKFGQAARQLTDSRLREGKWLVRCTWLSVRT